MLLLNVRLLPRLNPRRWTCHLSWFAFKPIAAQWLFRDVFVFHLGALLKRLNGSLSACGAYPSKYLYGLAPRSETRLLCFLQQVEQCRHTRFNVCAAHIIHTIAEIVRIELDAYTITTHLNRAHRNSEQTGERI